MMGKRQGALTVLGVLLIAYAFANAIGGGKMLCDSFSCRVMQKPALWWAGAFYAGGLLWAHRLARKVLSGLVVVGMVVECALVLTQVLLNLYCPACLGYTALFVLWVFLAGRDIFPLARKAVWGGAAVTLGVVVLVAPLTRTMCACFESPFATVNADEQVVYLFFEPTCTHCHDVLEMLEKMAVKDRVRLCPEAWSLTSVWQLVQDHCETCTQWPQRLKCLVSTLAVVRANNAFCWERGVLSAPFVVHQGRIVTGAEVPGYLLSVLENPLTGLDTQELFLPLESGGSCTVNACD
ncbi:hypothetical protein [Desulfosoma caldarium]|uniref:Vitamin K epoxide reductase family protein n=1 Tax=Desulfosoma caldarium TaxID=610254 RepID=A0A3N1UYD0_9BACT|nr:hypothetical protein [Desulfosoma caldarium]ROQ92296.1 hypothetical protein EDC27_2000 [Desulfosoma caldarium]